VILVVAATERELAGANGCPTLACGVGPVEAAVATATGLERQAPAAVLHVGIAGALRGCGIAAPELVIGSSAIYADLTTSLAPREVVTPPTLVAAAQRALAGARVTAIGTSASVGGAGCDVEAMEGFAVLRAAQLAGVPAVEVRAVANEIEEADRSRWLFDDAFAAIAAATPPLIEELQKCVS
jgi:futalosine hydrolase